MKTMGDEGIA